MKPPKKSKSPSAPKPADNQLTLDALIERIDTMTDISNALQVKVSRIDSWVDKLGERYDTELLSIRQQLDERAYTKAVDAVRGERMVTNYEGKPAEPKRPTLTWFEQGYHKIQWRICVDPATLLLEPGTKLRWDDSRQVITTYDGVAIGVFDEAGYRLVYDALKRGDKLHLYLTTRRRLGIKLGRP